MADKDGDGPSLELPSLGFGRKRGKKARRADEDETTSPETATAPVEPEAEPEPVPEPVAAPEPVAEPEPEAEPEPVAAPEPVAEPEPEPVPAPEPAEAETTVVEAQPEPPTAQMPAAAPPPPPARAPRPAPASPQPAAPPLFADEVQDRPVPSLPAHVDQKDVEDEEDAENVENVETKPRRSFSLPPVSPMTAALITGAVVGVLMVVLTGVGFRLCELVQGTSSCGDPGFLLLLAIVIVVVVVGKTLLDAWSLTDPGSTSFLAVGLLCVVALLFLVDVLFNWWMIIIIPVVAMLSFALSHWVTTAFVDTDE